MLKTVLNIAVDTVSSPSVMLRLKDFVLLVCSALGESLQIFSGAGAWLQSCCSLAAALPEALHTVRAVLLGLYLPSNRAPIEGVWCEATEPAEWHVQGCAATT